MDIQQRQVNKTFKKILSCVGLSFGKIPKRRISESQIEKFGYFQILSIKSYTSYIFPKDCESLFAYT